MSKAFGDGIPIPDVIDPPESMEMTLCIPKNRDHMAAFFGALYQLTIWNSWQQDGTQHGKELAAVWWRYYLSWDRAMSTVDCGDNVAYCCIEPSITKRINPVTGNVERSTDNGTTWQPEAGGLQSVIVQPVPPVTSGVAANKCDAATNVSGQVEQWITQVSDDFTTAVSLLEFGLAVLQAILVAVFTILTLGALTPIEAIVLPTIGAALAAAWAAGKTAFDAYWTTEHKNIILCAAYCTIKDDGSFDDAAFSDFWNKCNTELPPNPAKMLFLGFMSSVGKEGLNAMAASGYHADSDCSDCECGNHCGGLIDTISMCIGSGLTWIDDCTFQFNMDVSGANAIGQWRFGFLGAEVQCKYTVATTPAIGGMNNFGLNTNAVDCTQSDAVTYSAGNYYYGGLHYFSNGDHTPYVMTITIIDIAP